MKMEIFKILFDLKTLKLYSLFLAINLVFVVLILRGCFFLFVAKKDPVKTIIPNVSWFINFLKKKDITQKFQKYS